MMRKDPGVEAACARVPAASLAYSGFGTRHPATPGEFLRACGIAL